MLRCLIPVGRKAICKKRRHLHRATVEASGHAGQFRRRHLNFFSSLLFTIVTVTVLMFLMPEFTGVNCPSPKSPGTCPMETIGFCQKVRDKTARMKSVARKVCPRAAQGTNYKLRLLFCVAAELRYSSFHGHLCLLDDMNLSTDFVATNPEQIILRPQMVVTVIVTT